MPRYLTASHTFDLSAIMRAAWASARSAAVRLKSTPRAEFAFALQRVWGIAKSERSYALWCIEQDAGAAAEAARRAALSVHDRDIEDARTALMFAEHNDTLGSHRLVAAANARLHALQHAA